MQVDVIAGVISTSNSAYIFYTVVCIELWTWTFRARRKAAMQVYVQVEAFAFKFYGGLPACVHSAIQTTVNTTRSIDFGRYQ